MGGEADRRRWDRKYIAGEGPAHYHPARFLIEHGHLLAAGCALDAACGFGGNALYLASLGYQVDAIDVSGVALAQARTEAQRRNLHLNLVQADLDRWWVPSARYDLIVVFFYLNRGLMPGLAQGLRPGGLLFQANRNWRFLEVRPQFDAAYLLQRSELQRMAHDAGLEVLYHTDGTPEKAHDSRLIARRPA